MKKIIPILWIALASTAYADGLDRVNRDLDRAQDAINAELNSGRYRVPEPQPFNDYQPAPAPRNTGGWASCSYGVCNGYNNDGSSWWSSNAGGTIQYFYNQ